MEARAVPQRLAEVKQPLVAEDPGDDQLRGRLCAATADRLPPALSPPTADRFFEQYYSESAGVSPEDPWRSPLRATSLVGQPPAVVVTAEVHRTRYDGLIHGFVDMAGLSPAAETAVAATNASFRTFLHAG